jgi:hypothetical protein
MGTALSFQWTGSARVRSVLVYKTEAGPKLVGEYTILGGLGVTGEETLTP